MKLKYVLALADLVYHASNGAHAFRDDQVAALAQYCAQHHRGFNEEQWLYRARHGPSE